MIPWDMAADGWNDIGPNDGPIDIDKVWVGDRVIVDEKRRIGGDVIRVGTRAVTVAMDRPLGGTRTVKLDDLEHHPTAEGVWLEVHHG